MKIFVRRKELRSVTGLSPTHIDRLEAEGKFPLRVKLTDAKNGAVGWVLEELEAWAALRMKQRDGSK